MLALLSTFTAVHSCACRGRQRGCADSNETCAQAARGSDVQRMEEQLITVLGSQAALTVQNSCGPRLDRIDLLAAEPAESGVVPSWWENRVAPSPSFDPSTTAQAFPPATAFPSASLPPSRELVSPRSKTRVTVLPEHSVK